MFCKKCGKDIGDAKFCPWCGQATDEKEKTLSVLADFSFKNGVSVLFKKIEQFGYAKAWNCTTILATIAGLAVRVFSNDIKVKYYEGMSWLQDDYFAISENGRNTIICIMVAELLLSLLLRFLDKKGETTIKKCQYILLGISLLLQIGMITIQFPAPW